MNKYTDMSAYSCCPYEVSPVRNLSAVPFEYTSLESSPYVTEEDVNKSIESGEFTKLMCEVTLRVGASRYITGTQIAAYMMLAGIEQDWKKTAAALDKLCALRILRGVSLYVGSDQMMHAYTLNFFGVELCRSLGLELHKGLYRSKQERIRGGYSLIDSPVDVRKMLEANNIALRYLSAGGRSGRFEFERCLRFEDGAVLNDAVFRCALLIAFSPESSIVFDVVRHCDGWMENAVEKFSRYARMAVDKDFCDHILPAVITAPPVFVFCTENNTQAKKLCAAVQQTVDVYGVEPLFTTDDDINGPQQIMYALSPSGKKAMFELEPAENRKKAC